MTAVRLHSPKISVVIPCKNMGQYVGAAIRSVLEQTLPASEIIVVDDGSTDETPGVLESFGSAIRVIRGPGLGSAVSRNIGIMACTGEFIAFLDADDLWYPEKTERQIAGMAQIGSECGLSFTDYVRGESPASPSSSVLAEYEMASEGFVFSNLLRENFILTSSVIVSRHVLGRVGLLKPKLRGGQDYDFWLRVARHFQLAWVRETLVFYRRHPGAITQSAAYPHYLAQLWMEIAREHTDGSAEDRAYITSRAIEAAYGEGRHALRRLETGAARRAFIGAARHGAAKARVAPWIATTYLPKRWLQLLAGLKRQIAERRRGSADAPALAIGGLLRHEK